MNNGENKSLANKFPYTENLHIFVNRQSKLKLGLSSLKICKKYLL